MRATEIRSGDDELYIVITSKGKVMQKTDITLVVDGIYIITCFDIGEIIERILK